MIFCTRSDMLKGFPRTDVTAVLPRPRSRGIGPAGYYYEIQFEELEKQHIRMLEAGFTIDYENKVYVKAGYGPCAPAANGEVYGKGLYCKNYKEIAQREKEEQEQQKITK